MAVTLLNTSGYTWGIGTVSGSTVTPVDEVGIKAASFRVRVEPEFRAPRQGLQNAIEGWAIGPNQITCSIEGEINNTTGVMAATAIVAFTPANSITYFGGAQSGVLFMTDAEVTMERGSWKSVSINFQSNSGVPAA
jgi:hypothetical protein